MGGSEHSAGHRDVSLYLSNPPFYGISDYANLHAVKAMCGTGSERSWDAVRCVWGTTCLLRLSQLIGSNLWVPIAVPSSHVGLLAEAALAERATNEAQWVENEAARLAEIEQKEANQAIKAQKLQKAVAARRAKEAKEAREAKEAAKQACEAKKRKAEALARAPAPIARPPIPGAATGVSTWEQQIVKRGEMVPTPAELAECERLGFTPLAISFGKTRIEYGPSMSLSPHGRLLRWCSYLSFHVRCDVGEEELAAGKGGQGYFDKELLAARAEKAHMEFARTLNADALHNARTMTFLVSFSPDTERSKFEEQLNGSVALKITEGASALLVITSGIRSMSPAMRKAAIFLTQPVREGMSRYAYDQGGALPDGAYQWGITWEGYTNVVQKHICEKVNGMDGVQDRTRASPFALESFKQVILDDDGTQFAEFVYAVNEQQIEKEAEEANSTE